MGLGLSGGFKLFWGMAQSFLSCDREQVLLLPPDLADWLPEGHLARFVIETVGELDLEAVYGSYRRDNRGRPAHDSSMMVALVLYAYAVGVTTSRAIERRCVEDVAFRVISANPAPDHATIARFLIRHQAAISALFFDVLALCQRAGMLHVGTVAVDSTKLAANASLGQNYSFDGLRAEAERIVGEAIENDRREDELYGESRGDELPEELADPATRKARIKELLEQARREREAIEAERQEMLDREAERQARPVGQRRAGARPLPGLSKEQQRLLAKKYNVTDPDSGIVQHRKMRLQGYNVQTAVADGQVILATRVTGIASDAGQLLPTVQAAQNSLRRIAADTPITQVVADRGLLALPTAHRTDRPWPAGADSSQARCSPRRRRDAGPARRSSRPSGLPAPPADHRARVRALEAHPQDHPCLATRRDRPCRPRSTSSPPPTTSSSSTEPPPRSPKRPPGPTAPRRRPPQRPDPNRYPMPALI